MGTYDLLIIVVKVWGNTNDMFFLYDNFYLLEDATWEYFPVIMNHGATHLQSAPSWEYLQLQQICLDLDVLLRYFNILTFNTKVVVHFIC